MRERISIITDEISQDLTEVREFLREHDLHAVELRCVAGRRVPDLSSTDLDRLKAWARDGDPRVLAVSPGMFKCRVEDRTEIQRQLRETLPRTIDLARDLEAAFVVVFGFENPDGAPPPEYALEALRTAASACDAAHLPLLVENEPGFLAASAEETKRLLDLAAHPNLFANWDPLNGNVFDAPGLEAGLRELFPRVRHVHVKNGRLEPGRLLATCGPLKSGSIDWQTHLALLDALGYEGYLGVETHFEPVREGSVLVLRELREMLP